MSIPSKFMEIARDRLDREVFDSIYGRAVELERLAQMKPEPERVDKPFVSARVAAHFNGEPPPAFAVPHIAERIERRMDIEVRPADLGDLLRTVRESGPTVSILRQTMDLVQELEVGWRGMHFVVIYSKTRDKLITAYPKKKRIKPKRLRSGRPKDWRQEWPIVADELAEND